VLRRKIETKRQKQN